jgi:enamine deaminase RidA (YjgF/YER057c/UK114 family)
VPAGKKLIFIAGQSGLDDRGHLGDFEAQLTQAFLNLRKALSAVGVAPEQVVKLRYFQKALNIEIKEEVVFN